MDAILSFLADNPIPLIIFAFVIGFPCMILYLIELKVIISNFKKFNSPFFQLFLIRALFVGFF